MEKSRARLLPTSLALFLCAQFSCGNPEAGSPSSELPTKLPFEFTRPDMGAPIDSSSTQALTERLVGFLQHTNYYRWITGISQGVDASTGLPDYLVWWTDPVAEKRGRQVMFRFPEDPSGGGHNIYIPTSRILLHAALGYRLTKDPAMRTLTEQYAKGVAAACMGLVFDENDPNLHLMARNMIPRVHTATLTDGRIKEVDYSGLYSTYEVWNAQRLHYPNNPYWGDIWVTNMRSKDDVPHIFFVAPMLRYLLDDEDQGIRDAAKLALDCVDGFAKDVVDSGYLIRTKDDQGQPFVPSEDLASFVQYEEIVPNGECTAKLSAALLGYGDPKGNDCGLADHNDQEDIAVGVHYYNYEIVRTFHLSALLTSIVEGQLESAKRLMTGLVLRAERAYDESKNEPGRSESRWDRDNATFLMRAAMTGYPLTNDEARFIQEQITAALDHFESFELWDLWSEDVPDGEYPRGEYRPSAGDAIDIQDLAFFAMYCGSPLLNPAGAQPIDCAKIEQMF